MAWKQTEFRNNPKLGTFEDETFIVEVKAHPYGTDIGDDFYWLDISRKDKSTDVRWADLQRIKNELIGEKHEGMQLFPSATRLVDEANHYHLWVLRAENKVVDVGFRYLKVIDAR